jgi:hypothetical protein
MCEDLNSTAAEAQNLIYHISCQYIYSVISDKGNDFPSRRPKESSLSLHRLLQWKLGSMNLGGIS